MTASLITCWYRLVKIEDRITGAPEVVAQFNHISNGYDPEEHAPRPTSETQRVAWAGVKWEARRGRLRNGHVREDSVLHDGPMEKVRWV